MTRIPPCLPGARVRFRLLLALLAIGLLVPFFTAQAATNDLFARGLELARAGEFPEAASSFTAAAKTAPAVGTFLNLGLVEWNRGHAGTAILAWEQAHWIDPYDPRPVANLKFAREVAEVAAPSLAWYELASTWLPPNAWVWLAGATLWLAIGLLVLPRVLRRPRAGWHQTLAALCLCAFLFSLTANFGVVSRANLGFVIKKSAPLLLTPTHEGELISSLGAGEPARCLRTRGDFYFIRSENGPGWIKREDFGLICAGQEGSP